MRRLGCLALALALSIGLGFSIAWAARGHEYVPEPSLVDAAVVQEIALATAQGLTILEENRTTERSLARTVPLGARQCVAWILGATGPDAFVGAPLALEGHAPVTASDYGGMVIHRATCTDAAATAHLGFELGHEGEDYGPTWVHYLILTGPMPPDPRSYDRLTIDEALRVALDEAALRARVRSASPGGTPLGAPSRATRDAALLLPPNRATYAGLRALVPSPRAVSRVALVLGAPGDPFTAPTDEPSPPRAHTSEGEGRLLAVIDAGSLGADCIRVLFARTDDPSLAIPIRAVSLPSLEERVLAAPDPAIASDTLCPAAGLHAYVTAEGPGGDVEVTIDSIDAPAGSVRVPSTFEATRLVLTEVSALTARCAVPDDTACVELARFAAQGALGAGDPAVLLTPVCNRSGGEPCALLATWLVESGRAGDRTAAFERRACATGHLPTCAWRAAAFRQRGELLAAYQTYQFACDRGDADACAAMALFRDWQLLATFPAPVGPDRLP